MSTAKTTITRKARSVLLAALAAALAVLALSAPGEASAAPALEVSSAHFPTSGIAAGGRVRYTVDVSNTGTSATSGPTTVHFELPPASGVRIISANDTVNELFERQLHLEIPTWSCSIEGGGQAATCTGAEFEGIELPIAPGEKACETFVEEELLGEPLPCSVTFKVEADDGLQRGSFEPSVTACGGGASACPTVATSATDPTASWLHFDITSFDNAIEDELTNPYTTAGGHPHQIRTPMTFTGTLSIFKESSFANGDDPNASGQVKDIHVDLPPGLLANVLGLSRCSEAQLATNSCPSDSQLGVVNVEAADESNSGAIPLYNMIPAIGEPAQFGFNYIGASWVHLTTRVRSASDYGVTIASDNLLQWASITGVQTTFWGVPESHSHDAERFGPGCFGGCASSLPEKALLTMPTSCTGPIPTALHADSWEDPGNFVDSEVSNAGIDGCNAVEFSPTIKARPTTNAADSASGLEVDLRLPQNEDPEGTTEANLRDTTLTLPEGLVLNPAGANGLGACSPAQVGLTSPVATTPVHFTGEASQCPDDSKVASVEVDTPLIDHPLPGAVYVATPHDNPFNSLLAIYITVNDPQSGTVVKLAGNVHIDPQTGRLTTTVEEAPQLPFEDFKLNFFGGAAAPLRTPAACSTYQSVSVLTPWTAPDSGPPSTPSDSWAISQGANGSACAASEPNSPSLDAGTVNPVAGSYSPFVMNLRREDGTQNLSAVNLTLPPGLTGKLAGIPYCSDSALAAAAHKTGHEEQSAPSCPAASALGQVTAGAGAGPAPYYAKGTAYLTGPYKGAPLGMAIVTPAVAGPYDLGTIVVRVALHVDPATGQITANSDPIPQILQGIPLDIRSVAVRLDRAQFSRTGTSCDPFSFGGSSISTLGQSASLSVPFQLGECSALPFKPKLTIRLKGGTKRGAHPALTGILTMPEGGANLAKAAVALPHSEFLDQSHIGTVCTRVQFAEGGGNGESCPPASVYGHATATSPLVDYALEGPVFLRSSSHKLPDLVLALHGPASQPLAVEAVARIDSVNGGIRSTFESTPDLPVSKVVLAMEGGRKGLLENSTNICLGRHKSTAVLDGQNGKGADLAPVLKNGKCHGAKHRPHKGKPHTHRAAQRNRAAR